MAKITILTDANAPIGTPRPIPDTAIPLLKAIFGGANNNETANNTLDWIVEQLRHYVRERKLAFKRAADQTSVESGQVTEGEAFDTSWPVV